jgi:hypothetical protein
MFSKAAKVSQSPMISSPKKPSGEDEEEDREAVSEGSEEEEIDYENQYSLIYPSARNPEY